MSAGREASGLDRLIKLIDDWCDERSMSQSEFARQAGIDRQTLYNLRNHRNSTLRSATKRGIERLLGWAEGSVDAVLADDDPTPQATATGTPLRGVPATAVPTFESALETYGQALQQLRRVATTDPAVPPQVLGIIEDWEMVYTALTYGGVDAVLRALADRYRRGLSGETSPGQAG